MNEPTKESKRGKALYALIKKEFMDNIRNKWVLVISIVFVGSILLISAYGGAATRQEAGIQGFEFTMNIGKECVVLLISIIAIIMAKGAVSSEIESKSIGLLLTSKLGRRDVILGKFLGLTAVLATAIISGLGIGGLVIGFSTGFEGIRIYTKYILLSFLFSLCYLSITLCMSAFVKKTSQALAFGVFIWIFFNILWDLVLVGILVATGWEMTIGNLSYPDWYYFARLANPNAIFNTEVTRLLSQGTNLPELLSLPMLVGVSLIWILVPFLIAVLGFTFTDL